MVNMSALMKALPVSDLEPDWVASVGGFIEVPKDRDWQERIALLEPPAGQRIPYIEPVAALEKLVRRQSSSPEKALAQARDAVARMRADVPDERWVNFFDDLEPESPECLPMADFVAWLRGEVLVPSDILNFFEQVAEVAATTPMFRGSDNWEEPWSLENLPELPPPKAMIEFMPGAPWADIDDWGDRKAGDTPFLRWREAIRPIALELEKALGEPVYYFADLSSDIDDDDVHRFLVLHWCCSWKPESAFVRYLVKVSGASDVEELKTALIDPANYTHPFKMNDSFAGLEALSCHIDYLPPGVRRTIGVVFSSMRAREVAQSLLAQQVGAHAFIVAPKELATDDWVAQATRYCRDWTLRYVYDGQLDEPIDILASVDALCVIADEPTAKSGFDLKLSAPAENLLWLAFELGVDARYYHVERTQLMNPDTCLKKRGVPERVAAQQVRRAAFTQQLKEIRLDNDFGSSGLWDAKGRNMGYDLLDLPFPLVRRIAEWQRDYDETMNPPDMGDDAWWKRHDQEALNIARELQNTMGKDTDIKVYREQGWISVDSIDRLKVGES